jgi:hypothetical protein
MAGWRSASLTLRDLCNQVIHSFIFEWDARDDDEVIQHRGLAGFFVASDRARASQLYRIDVHSFIQLLRLVGTEDVAETRMIRDAAGDWQVSSRTADEMRRAGHAGDTSGSTSRTRLP